jgi:hypothetical protein
MIDSLIPDPPAPVMLPSPCVPRALPQVQPVTCLAHAPLTAVVGAYHYELISLTAENSNVQLKGGAHDWKLLLVQVGALPAVCRLVLVAPPELQRLTWVPP